ncbi:hypothetical protein LKD47_06255 [Roseburia sp. CLA-AA-H204]|mgnify:FL=1|uniref:GAF domain-containing protein n=1 Tax=Roseburia amylophila TaxID=2981794 RepID=A0AAW4WDD7_9FIRM|nr:hypothetical protein [Roseburia amylophila]MCC2241903.1 hypothetical protein [Roseburia amylophila]
MAKKSEDEEDKVKKVQKIKLIVWEFIKYFIAIINTIAAMASIVGLIISVVTKEKMAIVFYASAGIIIISVLLTIFVVIKSGKNDKMKEANKYAKGFHEILHLIRDCYGDLMEVIEDETYKRPMPFRKYITEKVMKMMDLLSRNLSEATGYKVRACIKTFDFIRDGEMDKNKMKLITLARSGQSNVNNMISEHYNPIPLNENTDFEYIFNINEGYVEERVHFFIVDDLVKYSQKEEYKNSNKKWKKSYTTTIVMPIRYLRNPSEDEEEAVPQYDIIGCLCIDSKKKNLFAIENRGFVIEYLKGIADILYVYLNECILYHDYLKEGIIDD